MKWPAEGHVQLILRKVAVGDAVRGPEEAGRKFPARDPH